MPRHGAAHEDAVQLAEGQFSLGKGTLSPLGDVTEEIALVVEMEQQGGAQGVGGGHRGDLNVVQHPECEDAAGGQTGLMEEVRGSSGGGGDGRDGGGGGCLRLGAVEEKEAGGSASPGKADSPDGGGGRVFEERRPRQRDLGKDGLGCPLGRGRIKTGTLQTASQV